MEALAMVGTADMADMVATVVAFVVGMTTVKDGETTG
jgi:hypothetical protein